jgi:hypothetical protein
MNKYRLLEIATLINDAYLKLKRKQGAAVYYKDLFDNVRKLGKVKAGELSEVYDAMFIAGLFFSPKKGFIQKI